MYKTAEKEITRGLSPAARGVLALFAGLFGVGMMLMAPSSAETGGVFAFGALCILVAVACVTRGRVRQFVGSTIGVSLLGLSVAYVWSQVSGGPLDSGQRSEPSVRNAILFLLAFGIPGITYAARAKFGFAGKSGTKSHRESGEADRLPPGSLH